MEQARVAAFLKTLKASSLTRQQIKTLRGQALSGDIGGAEKGLRKMKDRQSMNKDMEVV